MKHHFWQIDEQQLDCPDDYESLPLKTKAILRLGIERKLDFMFLFDTDTFIVPKRLLRSGFWNYDLYGLIGGNCEDGKYYPWPSGAGYWLSRKAMKIVVNDTSVQDTAEDRMVGQILGPYIERGEIKSKNDVRYGGTTFPDGDYGEITSHLARRVRNLNVSTWLQARLQKARWHGDFDEP